MATSLVAVMLASPVHAEPVHAEPVDPAPGVGITVRDVGLQSFRDMEVSEEHARIFVLETDRILVTDLHGVPVTWITDLPGALDLSPAEDGDHLLVALSDADGIGTVDMATLAVTRQDAGPGSCPQQVAATAGQVWFFAACDGQIGGIHALDPTTGDVTGPLAGSWGARLVTSPDLPGSLFVAEGSAPAKVTAYDASGGATPSLSVRAERTDSGFVRDLAVTADGSSLVMAGGNAAGVAMSPSDLSTLVEYPTPSHVRRVATSADGMVATGADFSGGSELRLFHQDSSSMTRTIALGHRDLRDGGVAFAGSRLVAVTEEGGYDARRVRLLLVDPQTTPSGYASVTVASEPRRAPPGQIVRVFGHLDAGPADAELVMHRVDATSRTLIATGPSPLDVETPVVAGSWYEVSTTGDAAYAAAVTQYRVLAPEPTPVPDPGRDIGLTQFNDIVVDGAHGRIFISQGAYRDGLVVTDLAGNVTARLTGLMGAGDMVLSGDGGTLWVPLHGDDAVLALDTATLARTLYDIGEGTCPTSVAEEGDLIWIAGSCDERSVGSVWALAPGSGVVDTTSIGQRDDKLLASPHLPGVLFRYQTEAHPGSLYRHQVAVDPLRLIQQVQRRVEWSFGTAQLSTDGGRLLTAGDDEDAAIYRTSDLSREGSYLSPRGALAAVERTDGVTAIGTASNSTGAGQVLLYDRGIGLPQADLAVAPVARNGLAFGGQKIYVVSGNIANSYVHRLHVLDVPAQQEAQVSISVDKASYVPGASVHVTARLDDGPSMAPISIYAGTGTDRRLVLRGSVEPGGTLEADVAVAEVTTFEVVHEENAFWTEATATTTANVARAPSSVSVHTDYSTYGYGGTARVTVSLNTAASDRTVSLFRTVNRNRSLVRTAVIPRGGSMRVDLKVTERTLLEVVFAGDDANRSARATRTVAVRAKVTASRAGYRYLSRGYAVYVAGSRYTVHAAVAPNHRGGCVRMRIQRKSSSGWSAGTRTGCRTLLSTSKVSFIMSTSRAFRGRAYRVRIEWPGDVRNTASASTWQYLRFK